MLNTKTTILGLALLATLGTQASAGDVCKQTARLQKRAAQFELNEEYKVAIATCKNILDDEERKECITEAREDRKEGKQLLKAQLKARLKLCAKLGGGAYDPEIDPEDFSNVIDNEFFPLPVGATWTYTSETEEGTETIVVTVLDQTREIMGVECQAVQDTVTLEGIFLEDTTDYYAQDSDGNVWYFGEISFNYDEEGFVEDIDGSWISDVEGAKPGIVMLADPTLNTTYRQEWWLGEAEDAGTVVGIDETVMIDGFADFTGCVKTEDFLPPEPDALENKFFAPGIGFIYETKDDSDETVELVSTSLLP